MLSEEANSFALSPSDDHTPELQKKKKNHFSVNKQLSSKNKTHSRLAMPSPGSQQQQQQQHQNALAAAAAAAAVTGYPPTFNPFMFAMQQQQQQQRTNNINANTNNSNSSNSLFGSDFGSLYLATLARQSHQQQQQSQPTSTTVNSQLAAAAAAAAALYNQSMFMQRQMVNSHPLLGLSTSLGASSASSSSSSSSLSDAQDLWSQHQQQLVAAMYGQLNNNNINNNNGNHKAHSPSAQPLNLIKEECNKDSANSFSNGKCKETATQNSGGGSSLGALFHAGTLMPFGGGVGEELAKQHQQHQHHGSGSKSVKSNHKTSLPSNGSQFAEALAAAALLMKSSSSSNRSPSANSLASTNSSVSATQKDTKKSAFKAKGENESR